MTSSRVKVTTLVLLAASLFVTPAIGWASNGPARSAPEQSRATQLLENAPANENTSAPTPESAPYAQREAAAKALQDFKGGEAGVYIGGSAVGIVLVVILLVIVL
jgi:hypothetical protein